MKYTACRKFELFNIVFFILLSKVVWPISHVEWKLTFERTEDNDLAYGEIGCGCGSQGDKSGTGRCQMWNVLSRWIWFRSGSALFYGMYVFVIVYTDDFFSVQDPNDSKSMT